MDLLYSRDGLMAYVLYTGLHHVLTGCLPDVIQVAELHTECRAAYVLFTTYYIAHLKPRDNSFLKAGAQVPLFACVMMILHTYMLVLTSHKSMCTTSHPINHFLDA